MSWILADPSLNDSEAILRGTVVSAKTNDWTLADHHLAFAHELHVLYFLSTVVQGDNNITHAYDKGYVIIRPSPLVAIVSGETEITRGNKQNIILNGSESYDPHVGPGVKDTLLTFYWLCKRSDEQFPTENPLRIQVVPIPLNSSEFSNGGCFGTGIGRLESTEPVVTLNASAMQNSAASYDFQLVVTKDARTSSDKKTVHVVEGSPPEVSLKLVY